MSQLNIDYENLHKFADQQGINRNKLLTAVKMCVSVDSAALQAAQAQPAQGLTEGEIDWAAVGRIIETHMANRNKFLTGTSNWGAAIYRSAIQKGQQS